MAFCYVLPCINDTDPIEIIWPTCLQMGWCELPPLFCTVSETAWDIAQNKLDQVELLEPHPLKSLCLLEEEKRPPSLEHVHSKVGCLHG